MDPTEVDQETFVEQVGEGEMASLQAQLVKYSESIDYGPTIAVQARYYQVLQNPGRTRTQVVLFSGATVQRNRQLLGV